MVSFYIFGQETILTSFSKKYIDRFLLLAPVTIWTILFLLRFFHQSLTKKDPASSTNLDIRDTNLCGATALFTQLVMR